MEIQAYRESFSFSSKFKWGGGKCNIVGEEYARRCKNVSPEATTLFLNEQQNVAYA